MTTIVILHFSLDFVDFQIYSFITFFRLVETLTLLSEKLGCYKISLECKDENVKFYESFGYNPDGQRFLVQRFKE